MKKSLLALASILAIVAGCAKENFNGKVTSHSGIKEITASLDSPTTKTYLKNDGGIYKLFWFSEETITVGAADQFIAFTLTEGAESPKGKFESSTDLPEAEVYYAVSPEMSEVTSSGDKLNVNYSSELNYVAESGCAEGGEIMVARSTNSNFSFRNAIGYIKFQLAVTEEETLDKIEISDKLGGGIAGKAAITFDGNEISAVEFEEESTSTITVRFNEDVTVTPENSFVTMIPVAPMEDGISITVTMKSGKSMTMTSSTPVKAGEMVQLTEIEFEPVEVAQVGEEKYYSFKQAVQAADELCQDVTIKLIADCNVGANCEIISTSEITIDLNGHTLYGVGEDYLKIGAGSKNVIITDSSAEQTGTITNRNANSTPIRIYGHATMKSGSVVSGTYGVYVREGSFVMEGGIIDAASSGIRIIPDENKKIDSVQVSGDAYIDSREGSGIYMHSPQTELTIRGGEIHAAVAACNIRNGVARIYDGTFCAKSNVIYQNPVYDNQMDIFGGKFHRDSINTIVYGHSTTDSTRVMGGFYNNSFSASYIPEGYSVASCDTTIDGRHYSMTVVPVAEIQATVSINGGAPIEKATINEAVNAAIASNEPALITLLADCTPTDVIDIASNNPITIDFNGKTLTCNGTKLIKITGENSDVTFKTSVEGGGIHQVSSASKCQTFRQSAGKLTIENGKYEGTTAQYAAYSEGGDTYVNGGEFIGDTAVFYVKTGTLHVNGGKFTIRETSARKTTKQIYINDGGKAIFNGGEFVGVYVTGTATGATFESGNYPSFTLSGACDSISIANGTFDQIHFGHTGTVTVKDGTFNNRVYMDGTGTLNIEGGVFNYNNDDSYKYAMYATSGTINIKNATFNGVTSYGTLRFRCCTATIGEGTVVNSTYSNGTAVWVGHSDYKTPTVVTIDGGTFNSPNGLRGSKGTLTVNGGTFNCTKSSLINVTEDVKAVVYGGYFNTTNNTATVEGTGSTGILKGGWFNKTIPAAAINSAYMLDDSQSTEVGGITYNYHVVENASAPTIATVNGAEYKDIISAITAAKEYAGSENAVTLKLVSQDTVTLSATTDLTNENGKEIILDLNNRIIKGTIDSLITTQGTLTITDSSSEKGGTITAAKRRLIFVENVGTLNLKGVTIDCTRSGYAVTTGMYSAVTLAGTSDAMPTMNISDGTVIKCKNYYFKAVFVYYGNLNTENCEIITNYNLKISGTDTVGTNKGYPAIMTSNGAVVNIGKGSFIQARGELNSRGALNVRIYAGNASVTVEDGTYIWSPGANGSIVGDDNSGIYATQKALYLNGGYFYQSPAKYIPIVPSGKSIQEVSPVASYTSSIGETVTFDYQVK